MLIFIGSRVIMSENNFSNFINSSGLFPSSSDRFGKKYFRIDLKLSKPDFLL
jgi:hypothetical protein